jgi:hypothetical protein
MANDAAPPPAVPPDDKDWTWVLTTPCGECGFAAASVAATDVSRLVGENAAAWRRILSEEGVARRPSPTVWSPLEYGCHVRDVFRLYDHRLHRMLDEDDPLFDNWDQDETAIAERYWAQDPVAVAGELEDAAETLAASFASVHGDQWARPGRRSDGAVFTVESFARYMIHDPIHHLDDVARGAPDAPS